MPTVGEQDEIDEIYEALQRLDADAGLAALHDRLAAFNFFEAVGMRHQEIKHSHFLAFLLSSSESHSLGDTILRWFLREIVFRTDACSVTQETVNDWDLSDVRVQREWQNIDLFITSPRNSLAVVIENKIWASEHSNQLNRYREIVCTNGYDKGILRGVFLTPHARRSSHNWYIPFGYETVCTFLERLCINKVIAKADVQIAVHHYTQLLRRHLVCDTETTRICHEIYARHKTVFERIYLEVHSNERQQIAKQILDELVIDKDNLTFLISFLWPNKNGTHYLIFCPPSWANEPSLQVGYDGRNDERFKPILTMQFNNLRDGTVDLVVQIRPGPDQTRQLLLKRAFDQEWLPKENIVPDRKYTNVYKRSFLTPPDYLHGEEVVRQIVQDQWHDFMKTDFPRFADLIPSGAFPANAESA